MWKRAWKAEIDGVMTIEYIDEERENPYTVESRKEAIPHANGESFWEKTFYWVVSPEGEDLKECYSLKEAKEFAETAYQVHYKPYEYCGTCKLSARNGGRCQVCDKYQRLPRDEYKGALSQCMKIGGPGC